MSQFVSGTPDWVKPILEKESRRTGVPTILLSAQIKQESGFNPLAGSVAGAMGISQFIAPTARSYGLRVDGQVDERRDPHKAIRAQADMMKDLLMRYGTVERALSAYNSGQPDNYLNPNIRTWYGSVGETAKYVKSITNMAKLKGKIDLERGRREKVDNRGILERLLRESFQVPKASAATPSANLSRPSLPTPSTARQRYPQSSRVNAPRSTGQGIIHTVSRGETPGGIAKKYLGDWRRWQEIYQGDPRKMQIGARLRIPTPGVYGR